MENKKKNMQQFNIEIDADVSIGKMQNLHMINLVNVEIYKVHVPLVLGVMSPEESIC